MTSNRLIRETGIICLAVVAALAIIVAKSAANTRPPTSELAKPAYQYVGLDRTLARVNAETGRIWILTHPEVSPTVSILSMLDKSGLRWREISVDRDKPPAVAR